MTAFPTLSNAVAIRVAARSAPILSVEQEESLFSAWREEGDQEAARQLVLSHLRMILLVARSFKSFGLPIEDLVQEGCAGFMRALGRFDPARGYRISTYARWWVLSAIQEYVLQQHSSVRFVNSSKQREAFFKIHWVRAALGVMDGPMNEDQVTEAARRIKVPEADVRVADTRLLARSVSLNLPVGEEGDAEWLDLIPDESAPCDEDILEGIRTNWRWSLVQLAMDELDERERDILCARHLAEDVVTRDTLGTVHGISRERIRQIESRAFRKLQRRVLELAKPLAA